MNKQNQRSLSNRLKIIAHLVLLMLIAGCGSDEEAATTSHVSQAAANYYREHPNFFTHTTIDALPQDLDWATGMDEPIFSSPEALAGGTLHTYMLSFPRTLRFVGPDSNGSFRSMILDNNAMSLMNRHPNTRNYIPDLAQAWAISPDRKTIYIKLDPTARYSDGQPVTAANYLFAFFFMRSEYIRAPFYNNWFSTEYTNITQYDDYTLSVSVPEAKPDPLFKIAGLRPIPQHFYNAFGPDYVERYQWQFEPTTGAYEVLPDNIAKGRSITLTKVKNWWAKDKKYNKNRFNPDRIRVEVIRDPNKAFEAFKRGELDMFKLNLPEYWYDKTAIEEVHRGYIHKATFYNDTPRPTYGLYLNTNKPLLDDRNIRQGLNHAINFARVLEFYFRGDYTRMRTSNDGYDQYTHPTLQAREFSIEKAQDFFAQAGFQKRGPDGILVNAQGQRLAFTITTGYQALQDVLTILREEAKKAGVELNIELLDGLTAFKKTMEKNHEIAFMAYGASGVYPSFWQMIHSDNANKPQTNNITNTSVPEIDRLVDAYERAETEEELVQLAHQIEEAVHHHAAFIPGFVCPWYRLGYWQWIRFPEHFDVRPSQGPMESQLFWIDPKIKKEVLTAKKANQPFQESIVSYDQWALTPNNV